MISTHLTPPTFKVTLLLINLDFMITFKDIVVVRLLHTGSSPPG